MNPKASEGQVRKYFEKHRRQVLAQGMFEDMMELDSEAFEKAVFKAKLQGIDFDEDYIRELKNYADTGRIHPLWHARQKLKLV